MKTKKMYSGFYQGMKFYTDNETFIPVNNGKLNFIQKQSKLFICNFQFEIDFAQYQIIEQQQLFNLQPALKGNINGEFSQEHPLIITVTLQPNLLTYLQPYLENINQGIQYLVELSNNKINDPLVNTQNWFLVKAEQVISALDKIGYLTFWDYLKLSDQTFQKTDQKHIIKAFFDFSQQELGLDKSQIDTELLGDIDNNVVNELFNSISTDLQDLLSDLIGQELGDKNKFSEEETIFNEALDFFKDDQWIIDIDEETSGFRMIAKGDNGQWSCYAQALEDKKQFIFYSILPVNTPLDKIPHVLDFLNRLNLELMYGNFQLDPDDGQIVFKTSIDVTNNALSIPLTKQVVYNNVLTMDQCLPALMSIIYTDISPLEAVAKI